MSSETKQNEAIANDDHCFCCGKKNDRGLQLDYAYPKEGRAETRLVVPDYFTGWRELTHGGLISMLLDETMAHACITRGLQGVTAELTVRFKEPLPVGSTIVVSGRAEEPKTRVVKTEAELTDESGTVYATGSAKFISSRA